MWAGPPNQRSHAGDFPAGASSATASEAPPGAIVYVYPAKKAVQAATRKVKTKAGRCSVDRQAPHAVATLWGRPSAETGITFV
jgi:hypothetical protein